jgi:ABC-2 type transport system permease protein
MNAPATAPSAGRALRRLFLTLFLRGRSARGLKRESAPKSIASRLTLVLFFYGLFGTMMALSVHGRPVFTVSIYLHGMTLAFLGTFIAASAGEVLFNKEEGDILMHRPVTARALLWAKISVLLQVSLWLAGAFNLGGFFVGAFSADPWWLYVLSHALSVVCEALFCAGAIVMIYQLCLRWFGRERLEGLMTTAQVIVAVAAVMLGQLGPQLIQRFSFNRVATDTWWLYLLPPAWFAGMDDALSGDASRSSWILACMGLGATGAVLGLAFGKLARDYETGLQTLSETVSAPRSTSRQRRWLDKLVNAPPLCWWLRDSVSRASFLLTTAYLVRDRDVKLRVYPGIAPMLVMPAIFMVNGARMKAGASEGGNFMEGFGLAFSGAYLGIIPMLALSLIRYSQQWQASDLFRVAPMPGPSPLCDGARRAVLFFLALPVLIVLAALGWLMGRGFSDLPLLIPGILVVPIYAMVPCLSGGAVPLSLPTEEAKSARRGLEMIGVMIVSGLIAVLASLTWNKGWFAWFVGVEAFLAVTVYIAMRIWAKSARWQAID